MSFEQLNKIIRQSGAWLGWMIFVLLFAIPLFAARLPIKTYTVADGLLRDNVVKIKQDSRGFLWFCTAEGVSRFDGYAFTNFTVADGLPERHANDFLETKRGEIWIATDAGLAKLNPKGLANSKENPMFTVVLPANEKAKSIRVLFEDESEQIFVGTSHGLYKLNAQNELEEVNLGNLLPNSDGVFVNSIIKDRRGAMWIGTSQNGLIRLITDSEPEQFTAENGLPNDDVISLLEDKNGRIWVGFRSSITYGLSLLVAEPKKDEKIVERNFTQKDGLPANWIPALYQTVDGQFWVATTRGLCLWQGENGTSVCKTYTAKNDVCDQEIWAIAEDKDGNLWTGTRCGAKKIARYGFTTYTEADGTGNPLADSIFENVAGELFVTFNKGTERTISRFDGEKFDLVKPSMPSSIDYYGWGWQQTVWQDRLAGDWWIPTGRGLFRFQKPARFEDLTHATPQKISFNEQGVEIFRLFEDFRGDFWIATTGLTNELWRWERAKDIWHNISEETGVEKNRLVMAFAEDGNGNLWISAGSDTDKSALIRYRDGQFKIFTQRENPLIAGWTRDLYVDDKGRLWIANTTNGVLRLDDVNADKLNFTRYTPAEGLSSLGVSCITEDEYGRIYIGTGRGLDRLNPDTGQIENFTTADGLPNSNVEIAYRDRKNNLWFGTTNGLARFIPEPEKNRQPPNVLITGLRVAGVAQPISILGENNIPQLDFSSEQKQISIDFLGLGAGLGEKLKYEYRFGTGDWTQTSERTVNFANLTAGEYRFEIRAQTADRIYSQNPAVISFRIAAPFWQKWWFIVALLVLTALVIYGFYRFRLARLLEVANMRTRIATDLHDDIGANLTKISVLSEVVNRELSASGANNFDGGKLLENIAETSRESVSAMSDIVWAINPKKDSLADLTIRMRRYAEEVLERREIGLEFNAPPVAPDLNLNANLRRNIYLIFKESLTNIVRHSNATHVEIDFRLENGKLILTIADNGRGFVETEDFDGNGLLNMKKRAAELKGNLRIDSAENEGTTIILKM